MVQRVLIVDDTPHNLIMAGMDGRVILRVFKELNLIMLVIICFLKIALKFCINFKKYKIRISLDGKAIISQCA
ncbi:MAG: hypothetical protein GXY18_02145 [Methanomicrobiales archaeon]|nr:hypothetical protein [Methanomicrobiales archaeon]